MKDQTIRNILYILFILGLILLVGRLEHIGAQEEEASTEICKLQDTEEF